MNRLVQIFFALGLLLALVPQAEAARSYKDITCETTATTGTGTLNLAGAATNYLAFVTQVTSGDTVSYNITSGNGQYETGVGVFTDATPDTLTRASSIVSTAGVGTALTLTGTSTVCLGFISPWTQPNLGTGDSPQFSTIELGAATDNTLARTAAGEASLEGKAIKHAGLQTISIPGNALVPQTGGACTFGTLDSGTNDIMPGTCNFSASTDQFASFSFRSPKGANESTITYQIVWTGDTATDATDDVIWGLQCGAFGDGDTFNTAYGTEIAVTDTFVTSTTRVSAVSSALTVANYSEQDWVICRVHRDADNASDNYNGLGEILNVTVFYTDNASSDD